MIYAETPKTAADSGAPKRKSAAALVQPPVKTNKRSTKKTGAKKALE